MSLNLQKDHMRGLFQTFLRTRLKIKWRGQEKVPSIEDDTMFNVFDVGHCGGCLLERQRLYFFDPKVTQQAAC